MSVTHHAQAAATVRLSGSCLPWQSFLKSRAGRLSRAQARSRGFLPVSDPGGITGHAGCVLVSVVDRVHVCARAIMFNSRHGID